MSNSESGNNHNQQFSKSKLKPKHKSNKKLPNQSLTCKLKPKKLEIKTNTRLELLKWTSFQFTGSNTENVSRTPVYSPKLKNLFSFLVVLSQLLRLVPLDHAPRVVIINSNITGKLES